MRIKTLPENYAGVLGAITYEIDQAATGEIITVGIPGDSDTQIVGEKRLAGETEYTVNIASYLGRRIEAEPVADAWIGLGKAAKRSCNARIVVNGQMSDTTQAAGGRKTCPLRTALSDSPEKVCISYGEKDEIAVAAPGIRISAKATVKGPGGSEEIAFGSVLCSEGIYVLVVDTEYVSSYLLAEFGEYREMSVEISESGDVIAKRDYRIVQPVAKAVRLCWQNAYGQVDYYTFSVVDENLNISKGRAYVADGYTTTNVEGETVRRIVSQCEPRRTIEWLTGITSSPKVWIDGDDRFTKVDILTEKVQVEGEKPGVVGLTIRNATKLTLKQ